MSAAKKVVLVSRGGYESSHDALLQSLIDRRIELFCVVGVDGELWEDVMDELLVGPDGNGEPTMLTTSHPGESVDEVVEFASRLGLDGPFDVDEPEVEVIEV